MQAWLRRFVLCLLAWSMAGSSVAAKGEALDLPTTVLEGAWRQVDGDRLCYLQDRELVTFDQGKQSVFGVEHFRPGGLLIVRNEGKLETWKAEVHDRILTIGKDENIQSYRRLAEIPSAVVLQPFPLGDSHPLPPDQIREFITRLSGAGDSIRP